MSRYAIADPPYPGKAKKHYGAEAAADGRVAVEVNHRVLIGTMCELYPDGWALATNASTLKAILALCPDDVRVAPWCKPFAVYKVGVNPGYCWEPIIWRGGRKRDRYEPTVRDYLVEPVVLNGGEFAGAKPAKWSHKCCELLGVLPGDTVDDLFPGTGAVGRAVDGWLGRTPVEPGTLFAEAAG